jgi:hypothetical protein
MSFPMQTVVKRHCCSGNLFIIVMFFPCSKSGDSPAHHKTRVRASVLV